MLGLNNAGGYDVTDIADAIFLAGKTRAEKGVCFPQAISGGVN